MSEKIYALLLRLYPSSFRRAYGEEALQLFRDRARDERGFLSGLRLWLDLLGDLAISIPRWYRTVPAAMAVSPTQHLGDGIPSFHILEAEALSFRSLFYGAIASLVVYGSLSVLVGHGGNRFRISDIAQLPSAVSAPVLIYSIEPEFSERARKAKASGDVLVSLWVDEEGNPRQVRTLRGLGMGLDERAVEAVKQYRFRPAMEGGKPVPVQLNVAVNFQIF